MRYYIQNSIHIVEVPVDDFKIVMCNKAKKTAAKQNYCTGGFFAPIKENGTRFTLPVGQLICDYETTSPYVEKYCSQRGTFKDGKYSFNGAGFKYNEQFYGKTVTTFFVSNGMANIKDMDCLPENADYAISGIPIMRNGKDVKFDPYVLSQGWEAGSLYGTWHTFIGLKNNNNTIYVMGLKTKKGNMITAAEAYNKFKAVGLTDVIKLDGGGSYVMNVDGKSCGSTLENRIINTIITFEGERENPYSVPTVALQKGNKHKEFNRWLQWQLSDLGYFCDVDGSFGNGTLRQVLAFQRDHGLAQDGSVGPATRAALLEK